MQRSIYTTIETLVPRGEVGGLENSNYYLQIFGEKGKSRKVINFVLIVMYRIGLLYYLISQMNCFFKQTSLEYIITLYLYWMIAQYHESAEVVL